MIWKFLTGGSEPKAAEKKSAKARSRATKPGAASSNLGRATQPSSDEQQPSYDPYNSGAFDKAGAWSKIKRK